MQIVENQSIAIMPTNDDTRTIVYDTKFLISEPGRYPPIAWKISKIFNSFNGDITRFTMTQEQFDPAKDNEELMIANYYDSVVTPEILETEEEVVIPETRSEITADLEIVYSGLPAVRAGGGYKKFTLKFKDDGKLSDVDGDVEWVVRFGDYVDKLENIVNGNIFKVKCLNDYSLIGKAFTLEAKSKYGSKSIIVEVTSL